jgi:hypothetical protein
MKLASRIIKKPLRSFAVVKAIFVTANNALSSMDSNTTGIEQVYWFVGVIGREAGRVRS